MCNQQFDTQVAVVSFVFGWIVGAACALLTVIFVCWLGESLMIYKITNADRIFMWIGYYVASVALGVGLPILILWLVLSPASPFASVELQQPL